MLLSAPASRFADRALPARAAGEEVSRALAGEKVKWVLPPGIRGSVETSDEDDSDAASEDDEDPAGASSDVGESDLGAHPLRAYPRVIIASVSQLSYPVVGPLFPRNRLIAPPACKLLSRLLAAAPCHKSMFSQETAYKVCHRC